MSHRADLDMKTNSSTQTTVHGRSRYGARLDGATPLDLFAAAVGALLPVAIVPEAASYTFTPKLGVQLVVLAVGLPLLVRLAIRSPLDRAARACVLFLLVGAVSAAISDSGVLGIFGPQDGAGEQRAV